ncbi:rho guanine nucleotide exchange factor 15 isoform X1 [Polypterus senegalus]|uniref:rho guanine nucleotide exchange factor 15 isoform X1 n=1 Tax=Polypterus senegalus TaxID=55291 RepID=UPI0019661039|nr:rho guanine nucleotide exchange factor 15 isoform X1 [Polypterus senegalus]XP_039602944.1 rho guanine nucleotide exchange factor 15 isoform X1 [Polypterus senegalus]
MSLPDSQSQEGRPRPPVKPKPAVLSRAGINCSSDINQKEAIPTMPSRCLPSLPSGKHQSFGTGRGSVVRIERKPPNIGKVQRIVNQFCQQEKETGKCPIALTKPEKSGWGTSSLSIPRIMHKKTHLVSFEQMEKPNEENDDQSLSSCEQGSRSDWKPSFIFLEKDAEVLKVPSLIAFIDPDGKEVDSRPQSNSGVEELSLTALPYITNCRGDCGCLCHQEHPGMVLVWVPLAQAEQKLFEENGQEEDLEDSALSDASTKEDETVGQVKGKIKQMFMVNSPPEEEDPSISDSSGGEGYNSLSSQSSGILGNFSDCSKTDIVLTSYKMNSEEEAPVQIEGSSESQDIGEPAAHEKSLDGDSVYECSIILPSSGTESDSSGSVSVARGSVEHQPVSAVRIRKPVRRSKLPSQASLSIEKDKEEDVPPAVPPRLPKKPPRTASASNVKQVVPRESSMEDTPILNIVADGNIPNTLPPKPLPPKQNKDKKQMQYYKDEEEEIGSDWDCLENEVQEIRLQDTVRHISIDWESKLQDEPLYQTYREFVISKEIKRQSVSRNISKTSIDFISDSTYAAGTHKNKSKTGPPQSLLWQELPSVRESGILAELSPAECTLQESMFEVLTSEASYLRSLNVLIENFMESRELAETIIIREKKILFSNITRVREVSERFLKDLKERVEDSLIIPDVCDIIHYHSQHNFSVYIDYVRNQIYQEKTYTSLMEKNMQFATVITRLQESPQCQRLPFMSFLLLPFQRITRIKMLIENILKKTEEGTIQEQTASKALSSVSKIIDECNSQVGKMKQMEELIHIAKTVEFDKLKALPLISQTRYLEKRGDLYEMVRGGTIFSSRTKFCPVYLFLFNDLLLITIKKSCDRYVVCDHAHRSLVQIQPNSDVSPGTGMDTCFYLTLLENHQGKMVERLLKAPTQSDMHRWMAAFPNPNITESSTDETIYDEWDCPQVHCVESYSAQQADELSMEPTDIINVLRKTAEGWYEGIRLSDGQRGWFPANHVQEITNEHVRRRNLRERYRVIRAAEQLTKLRTRTGS